MSIDRTSSATREDDTPASATSDDTDTSTEQASDRQTSPDDRTYQPAETRSREEYADAMRADDGPMPRDSSRDNRETPEQEPRDQPERRADQDRAEPRDRETYADQVRADHGASEQQDQAAEAPTLTDADQAGTSDRPPENELVSSGQRPEADQPGDQIVGGDQAATPAQDQQGASYQPETVTFENKDIEVTHNARDGIWVEGLPGDPPTRIGDILTSPEESGRSRLENLQKEATKDADDLIDMGGKWTDLIRDTLGTPPPTHSMTNSRLPEITATQPDHGINAGHGAEAFLTMAIVGAAAVHKLHERWERAWHH